ncbi:MAG: Gfo/Idh/MocA family oxidoreductase [Rhodospirillaceae bacterium]|jgi:predicted dehydrogenase|nr:Gfo/Idh/MocA family oxidoreductase [Rhodospirillaceae bacterium]MBT4940998.1 Gfo/Idh/MocA family oxidoreductase [Rhodospirillaceae bacterium]MBT7268216.1 Gfo/Idh/MocA family oxidoreductase [Rhodospirillaceae bacterium]
MSKDTIRVASLGLGWWSDVLAEGVVNAKGIEVVSCFTRSEDKRKAFADKFSCAYANSYEELLEDDSIDAIINTTPNNIHLETTRQAAEAGKHVFLDKPIANSVGEGMAIAKVCRAANVKLSIGFQRRRENQFRWVHEEIKAGRFGQMVQAEANISRDRLGQFEDGHWRYTAEGMPGGVMLQIGPHYVDVLEMLMGPIMEVSGMLSQLVLPGDNPDVAGLVMKHENGAISTLNAGYASAGENYVMNIYGKDASALFSLHTGMYHVKRGEKEPVKMEFEANDTIAEQMEEFGDCIRTGAEPEVGGEWAARSLAVIRAGVKSAREKRYVEIAEIMESGE